MLTVTGDMKKRREFSSSYYLKLHLLPDFTVYAVKSIYWQVGQLSEFTGGMWKRALITRVRYYYKYYVKRVIRISTECVISSIM